MNRTEKALWQRVKLHLPGTVERVENVVAVGFPDVSGVDTAGDYWVELKAPSKLTAPENPVELLRESQMIWAIKRLPRGCVIFILAGYKKGIALYRLELAELDGILEGTRLSARLVLDITGKLDTDKRWLLHDTIRREILCRRCS